MLSLIPIIGPALAIQEFALSQLAILAYRMTIPTPILTPIIPEINVLMSVLPIASLMLMF